MKKLALTTLIALLFIGCGSSNPLEGAGSGFWDGITILFAFIGKMFGADVNIYEVANNGNWYNFGFLIGVGIFGFNILEWLQIGALTSMIGFSSTKEKSIKR